MSWEETYRVSLGKLILLWEEFVSINLVEPHHSSMIVVSGWLVDNVF